MRLLSLALGLLVLWPGSAVAAPEVIAHRGVPHTRDENTIPSLRLAERHGADRLEFDVRLLRSGVPVVIHDSTLDRTTDCSGRVSRRTWSQIRHCRTPQGHRIRQLRHVCQAIRTPALVDIKQTREHWRLRRHLRECPAGTQVMTRDGSGFAAWLAGRPWPVVVLTFGDPGDLVLDHAAGLDVRRQVARRAVSLHQHGFLVYAGTLTGWDQPWLPRLLDAGVDGVITDRTKRTKELM